MAANSKNGNITATAAADDMKAPGSQRSSANPEIVIDAGSGISVEEQREIIVQINGIAEKNRLSLSAGTETGKGLRKRFKAKKNGGLFPVLVNIFAVAALAGGFFLLYSFQTEAEIQAREGTRVFNTGERALIYEIRRETTALLAEKDREINAILASLTDLETQMHNLLVGSEILTMEQQAIQTQLRLQQEERLAALALARDERSRILDEARSQEARLQAQLDARTRELAAITDRHAAELEAARNELAQASREQAQAATVEAQIAAFFANAHAQVAENRFQDAEQTVIALREFINTPAFQGLRLIQARRDLYIQAANTLEAVLEERRTIHQAMLAGALPPDLDAETRLREEIAQLERVLTERESTIDALGDGASGAAQRISQLENSVGNLERTNTTLQSENSRLNTQVGTLQGNLTAQTQTAATLRQEVTTNQAQIAELNQEITTFRAEVPGIREELRVVREHVESRNSQVAQFDQALSEFEAQGLLQPAVRQRFIQIFQGE